MSDQRPFAVKGMDISAFMCEDGARAIAWYRDVLGLEPVLVYPNNRGAEYELPDGTTFGLFWRRRGDAVSAEQRHPFRG